jgi:hypothetical protein
MPRQPRRWPLSYALVVAKRSQTLRMCPPGVAPQRAVEHGIAEFGRLDGVVNNAGIIRNTSFGGTSEEDFDRVMAVHVKAPLPVPKPRSGIGERGGSQERTFGHRW